MIRTGTIKPVLLLALGIITIALVGPAAGDAICKCPDNQTCMMMQSSMGEHKDNKTIVCYMMGDHIANESRCILMDQNASKVHARLNCTDLWLEKAINLHHLHMEDPSTATEESQMEMMEQMMQAHICVMGKSVPMDVTDKARMDCAKIWLKKAMEVHDHYMKEHGMDTNKSEMKMMEQMMDHMMHAYECMDRENMTKETMNNTTMVHFSEEHEYRC